MRDKSLADAHASINAGQFEADKGARPARQPPPEADEIEGHFHCLALAGCAT
jgi:hypothetical protein